MFSILCVYLYNTQSFALEVVIKKGKEEAKEV